MWPSQELPGCWVNFSSPWMVVSGEAMTQNNFKKKQQPTNHFSYERWWNGWMIQGHPGGGSTDSQAADQALNTSQADSARPKSLYLTAWGTVEILTHVWDWIKSWMLNSGRGNSAEGKPTSAHQLRCESSCSLGDKAGESRTETATASRAPSSGLLPSPGATREDAGCVSNAGCWGRWWSDTSCTSLNTPQRRMQRHDTCSSWTFLSLEMLLGQSFRF